MSRHIAVHFRLQLRTDHLRKKNFAMLIGTDWQRCSSSEDIIEAFPHNTGSKVRIEARPLENGTPELVV